MQSEIKRWGNSAAVRLPTKLLAEACLDVGVPISLEVQDGKIVIEALSKSPQPALKLPFSEAELLKRLTPETAHAGELASVYNAEIGNK